jgi:hypothetical protein
MRAIIDNCLRAQRDPGWSREMMRGIPRPFRDAFAVVNTTGPALVSRTLAEYPQAAGQVTVLFPEDICNREMWRRFGSYGVHLMAGTWRDRPSGVRRRLLNWWWAWQEGRSIEEARRRGPGRLLQAGGAPLPSPPAGSTS